MSPQEEKRIVLTDRETQAVALVQELMNIVKYLRQELFVEGVDFGKIPGTGDKPTLLLPGMEKLLRSLKLRPQYTMLKSVEEFGDKPLFFYRYQCDLYEIETGMLVASANGSANSYETKWRWRQADRTCPHCSKPTIIKGKTEYGGGWVCFAKKGGCGAKFADGDASIEGQQVGRIENADIFDQVNTIDKIAQKRALSSAIKGAANVSEYFTVDLEDNAEFALSTPPIITITKPDETPTLPAENPQKPPSGANSQQNTTPTGKPFVNGSGQPVPQGGGGGKYPHKIIAVQVAPNGTKPMLRVLCDKDRTITVLTRKLFQDAGWTDGNGWAVIGTHIEFKPPIGAQLKQMGQSWDLVAVQPKNELEGVEVAISENAFPDSQSA